MITVTRINGSKVSVNALLIETIEEIPETIITLTNGKKILVLEKVKDVIVLIKNYLHEINMINAVIKSQNVEGS
ncbi:flagellar FlbD family protein [Chengkuizengella axinellae]|uniref:Flagellar FlbD family protein n=1 Tax=Chengkuizengella axinellae TaxID=3064388 RepID=A0ABT9IVU3_9BACL|nr:flagellar FlbD family protein [Chengkuizengella sp. 2205SS18-9]MDP5273447.1 flagellar FlbD family protein [Chengkuizengella sp. 2205SS18-9]